MDRWAILGGHPSQREREVLSHWENRLNARLKEESIRNCRRPMGRENTLLSEKGGFIPLTE